MTERLDENVRNSLGPSFPDLDLESIRIRIGLPFLVRVFSAIPPAAVVLGRTIYFDAGFFDPTTPKGLAAIGHELVHLRQAASGGFARFAARYVRDYLRGRLRGLSPGAAYEAIPYEVEAYAVERKLRTALEAAREITGPPEIDTAAP